MSVRYTGWMYFVYLLECADKSIYTGIATDVERRFKEHQKGTAAAYTRSRKAVRVLYTEKAIDRSTALKREAAIKKLTRTQKLELAAS
ncbi:MAG: excinuclease subunit domain protein putative endonuclease [Candidatus Kaiserbacteria bacterium]|nr:excinuclease subunit domain protein putative endonuclease [Candidatus Kaiserbacteria bacterium]